MVQNSSFRSVNTDLTSRLAAAANGRGESINRVTSALINGPHPITPIQCYALLNGFQYACTRWIGLKMVGSSTPENDATACNVAREVLSWLDEKAVVNGREVSFLELGNHPVIKHRLETCANAVLQHCGTKTE